MNENKINKSVIIEYINFLEFKKHNFDTILNLCQNNYQNFNTYFFVIIDNVKWQKYPLALHLADWAEQSNLILIDEWIWLYFERKRRNGYQNIYKSVLWFAKEEKTIFNNDFLRVEHIWKDVEWGKREKNYHPLGKDPGNVLLLESAKNGIIQHQNTIPNEELLAKLILSQTENENESYLIYSNQNINPTIIQQYIIQKKDIKSNVFLEKIN